MQLDHMLLQLKRPAEREAALTAKIESMHKLGSPDLHQWLTAEQIGADYGPNAKDLAAVSISSYLVLRRTVEFFRDFG
jgi:subtilase family serine protease